MQLTGELRGDAVSVGGDARQRFYDSRGYGRPLEGDEIELSRVEAAHLLFRGDLGGVSGMGFERFFVEAAAESERFALRFLVYADLRDRGFYLSPAREAWPGADEDPAVDFAVFPRGKGPGDGEVAHRVRVAGERESVPASELSGLVLAVVDEESEITYLEAGRPEFDGGTDFDPPSGLSGALLDDRVVVWDAPEGLYERGFFGQPLTGRAATVEGALQLSLLEAAYLAEVGALSLSGREADDRPAREAAAARGRAVEGERFDRRLRVYAALRERDVVPKTGFKFGADFRTYDEVETVETLPHSERLVRVLPRDHRFDPRALSLDVRLAGGVRKRMVFALTGANSEIDWLSVSRLTP